MIGTMEEPDRQNELDRLQELSALGLERDAMKEQFEPLIRLAKHITDSPMCEVNVIDAYQQWTVAGAGGEMKVLPREESVCQDTMHRGQPYEIPDLARHDRYKSRFYVEGDPYLRYYCGVPLTTSSGYPIGSICVLDQKAKHITDTQKEQLQQLADILMDQLEAQKKRRRAEGQLEATRQHYHKLNHDIRGPISGIAGLVEIVQEEGGLDGEQRQLLDMISDCADTVIDKIDGILENVQDGKPTGSQATTLSALTIRIRKLYQPQAMRKNISLQIDAEGDTDAPISKYHGTAILQIAGNLISNALKFTPDEGQVGVTLAFRQEDGGRVLSGRVRDTGPGMTDSQIRALEAGAPMETSAGTRGEKSFGIGLRHVRELIDKEEGTLQVSSPAEGGSVFSFELPFH